MKRLGRSAKNQQPADAPVAARSDLPRDLFLVGSTYSGSTHLGALIAANLDAAYVGEMAHLPRFMRDYRLYDEEIGCLLCSAEDRECPVWSPETVAAAEEAGPAGSMDVLRKRTGHSLVVDGSKFPEWIRQATNDRPAGAAPVAAVLCVRSPLNYVLSAAGGAGVPVWDAAHWWRDTYTDALRTLARRAIPVVIIRNEEVRARPHEMLAKIAHLVGREAPADLAPAASTHSIAGNLWVQKGYSIDTAKLHYKLGLRKDSDGGPTKEGWNEVAQKATTTERTRPRNRIDALTHAQYVLDCPGLPELAQNLGYQLAVEVDRFVAEAEARNA